MSGDIMTLNDYLKNGAAPFKFVRATMDHHSLIMPLIRDAQNFLKQNGVDQWQNGFPSTEDIKNDINHRHSYVIYTEDKLIGFVVYSTDIEEVYNHPIEGSLKLSGPYLTIHRTAVSKDFRGKGISRAMFSFAELLAKENDCSILRIDTHKDNKVMQHIIEREGFSYCELVQLPPENELRMRRLVFEKSI